MSALSWPVAFLLAVLVVCTSALVWKGAVPSHALFVIGGAIVGWLVPRGASASLAQRRNDRDSFPQEEIPTKPDGSVIDDPSATRPMLARSLDELRKKK